jgi:hypothetical protein
MRPRPGVGAPREPSIGKSGYMRIVPVLAGGLSSLGLAVGCSGTTDDTGVDVTAACDRLEELANAMLGAADATSPDEVRVAIQDPLDAFTSTAAPSGDDRLASSLPPHTRPRSLLDRRWHRRARSRERGGHRDRSFGRTLCGARRDQYVSHAAPTAASASARKDSGSRMTSIRRRGTQSPASG